jgi:hypothetical protein
MDKFLENLEQGAADNELGLDARHMPDRGALAWFEPALGGKVVKEKVPGVGTMLVGIGKPTGDDVVDMVKRGRFRFASLEFHPNYRSNVKQRYLSDDLTLPEERIDDMPFELKLEEDGTAILTNEQVKELQNIIKDAEQGATELEEAQNKVEELETELEQVKGTVVELEDKVKAMQKIEQPQKTEREIELEERIIALERDRANQWVEMTIEKARNKVDENGMGHSAVFLNLMETLMSGAEFTEGETAIKLEDATSPAKYGEYVRKMGALILEKTPGQMKREGTTQPEPDKKELEDENDMFEQGKKDAQTIWSITV